MKIKENNWIIRFIKFNLSERPKNICMLSWMFLLSIIMVPFTIISYVIGLEEYLKYDIESIKKEEFYNDDSSEKKLSDMSIRIISFVIYIAFSWIIGMIIHLFLIMFLESIHVPLHGSIFLMFTYGFIFSGMFTIRYFIPFLHLIRNIYRKINDKLCIKINYDNE